MGPEENGLQTLATSLLVSPSKVMISVLQLPLLSFAVLQGISHASEVTHGMHTD